MIKKILIAIVVIIIVMVAVVFIYRHAIIQYYAEKIIRSNLPPYIKFEKLSFDFSSSKVILDNLKVSNPPGFSSADLIEISSISCKYRIKGVGIPEGLEISEVIIKRPDIAIERLRDGRINVVGMENFVKSFPSKEAQSLPADLSAEAAANRRAGPIPETRRAKEQNKLGTKKLSEIIKLPPSFIIRDAKIELLDRLPYDKPHLINIESVNGEASISFDDYYSKILNVAFTLEGNLNGASDEPIRWIGSLNPTTAKITMSNRFEVVNLDMVAFEPYYDKFSPFIFKRGKFSGTLVFDFNNGDIGSTNEVRLSDILFWVKPGYENAQMWETNVQDLLQYFSTPTGDIVFDFKLKGDMNNPTFYLGPISKRAITSMAINKISNYAIDQVSKQAQDAGSNIGKAKEYIDLFKGLIKK